MNDKPVEVAVTYRFELNDGFGAHGWKLDEDRLQVRGNGLMPLPRLSALLPGQSLKTPSAD